MTNDFKIVRDSALNLDVKQRAELARQLLISLDEESDEDVEQAWIEEINRRKAQVEAGEVNMIDAGQVLHNARELIKK